MTANAYPVLTVRPPWSWALLHGKPVENRSWEMKYKGPLWLHSGARSRWDPDGAASPLVQAAWDRYLRSDVPDWPGLPCSDVELGRRTTLMAFGTVTSLMEVTGCHFWDECGPPPHPERPRQLCSPWAARDQWHIELTVRLVLPEPVPCRGMLGLWWLPDEVEARVRRQLEVARG